MTQPKFEVIEFCPAADDEVAIDLWDDMYMLTEEVENRRDKIAKFKRKIERNEDVIATLIESFDEVDEILTNYLRGK